MDGYDYLAAFLIFFLFFIYIVMVWILS